MPPTARLPISLLLLLFLLPSDTLTHAQQPTSTPAPMPSTTFLESLTENWSVVIITLITTLPWTIVAVWDAIDSHYRTRNQVAFRLILSSICLILAYSTGLFFSLVLTISIFREREFAKDRHDEVATVLVLLVFNLWHVFRNIRGWLQFFAIRRLSPLFETLQIAIATNFPRDSSIKRAPGFKQCVQGIARLRVSNRLFDNEMVGDTPFLSPFFRLSAEREHGKEEEAWGAAMWRAWWTQDISVDGKIPVGLSNPTVQGKSIKCDRELRRNLVEDLLDTDPSWPREENNRPKEVWDDVLNVVISTKEQWATCLKTYGSTEGHVEGQQDLHGPTVTGVMDTLDETGIAVLIYEKIERRPNRMSALWYNTACFEEVYEQMVAENRANMNSESILFPSWSGWIGIAQDIGTHLPRPVYLSGKDLINFAGELASASVILARYPDRFRELVDLVYKDGLNARWTFGWSGLLACFSTLWTKERIYVAMLNGLSLLALTKHTNVRDINSNVRSMLYGYAAFEVSDRAVGKLVAEDRNVELLRRYKLNKGKTCRGSGLCATRLACMDLGLPAEASHMDGLPAFSTGWCDEYILRKPGNQRPEHGQDHEEVEELQGSSNAWRYPSSVS